MESPYKIIDYTSVYQSIMQFNKNKTAFIHQWYPFVEGYSKEFINSIIDELDFVPKTVLDPFAGSGTTPVELQALGISSVCFEVSPFMHLLTSVKLRQDYTVNGFQQAYAKVAKSIAHPKRNIREYMPAPEAKTIQERPTLQKWLFNWDIMSGLLDIKYAISLLVEPQYRDLFRIAFASMLLEVSNVYRNGKCLSYKKDWKNTVQFTRKEVHEKFLTRLATIIEPDIRIIEAKKRGASQRERIQCYAGDARKLLPLLESDSVDLVITSPPYLNSRDYTDIYCVELWMLDLIDGYEAMRHLRGETLRSHVQVPIPELKSLEIAELQQVTDKLELSRNTHWSPHLCNMIKGYFADMDSLFNNLHDKMSDGGKVFFNVANSAYYGVEIKVDEIVCSIAETRGFKVDEIREARQLRPSGQQKEVIKSLRESVIVMSSN